MGGAWGGLPGNAADALVRPAVGRPGGRPRARAPAPRGASARCSPESRGYPIDLYLPKSKPPGLPKLTFWSSWARDVINHDAKPNYWLLDEVADLCKTTIRACAKRQIAIQVPTCLRLHETPGLESCDKRFGPRFIPAPEEFLLTEQCFHGRPSRPTHNHANHMWGSRRPHRRAHTPSSPTAWSEPFENTLSRSWMRNR